MQNIGKHFNRQLFWLDYDKLIQELPESNWVCLAITNKQPDIVKFEKFVRASISNNILEFKGHGYFGEMLHDIFDETMVAMETLENHAEIDVMTTFHDDVTLADTFWQSFYATCLPETADFANIKIVCTDLDGINRIEELKSYVTEFENGWLPSENFKHEIWQDKEGLTSLCLADERGDDFRKQLESGSTLIHTFYAESHFEAMTNYYKSMNWGIYTTDFENDKEPYAKNGA